MTYENNITIKDRTIVKQVLWKIASEQLALKGGCQNPESIDEYASKLEKLFWKEQMRKNEIGAERVNYLKNYEKYNYCKHGTKEAIQKMTLKEYGFVIGALIALLLIYRFHGYMDRIRQWMDKKFMAGRK